MTSSRPRILNVNDREIPRYVNAEILRAQQFDVVSVATGEEAVSRIAGDIDLVLLDIKLPGIDGFDVCRHIKRDPATANIAVLLSSATFVSSRAKVTGLESGADGYLVQPFEPPELIATIRALLRTRAAERRATALAGQLQQAMEVRDEFLAMLGHELRNPIGAITTAVQLLDKRRDPDAVDRYAPILRRQTMSLGRIVDDLLDVSRMTRGKVTLERQIVDLRAVVDRCREALGNEVLGRKHQVEITVTGPRTAVDGDPVRLEQIVMNLLTNAVKYTPSGGHVAVVVGHDGDSAVLSVTDDGIGMDASTLARAFDVFAQGQQGLDRSRGGLGLGLTVVRGLVELHGGTIRAESDGEGRGSRFTLTLPLVEGARLDLARIEEQPSPAYATPEQHLRVLIVDDNHDLREALADALRGERVDVITEADGRAGLARALTARPDAMLIDIGLPEIDGYEVARRLRECGSASDRPRLIAMTGYGQPEDRARALASGFDVHMVKPISFRELLAHLASVPAR